MSAVRKLLPEQTAQFFGLPGAAAVYAPSVHPSKAFWIHGNHRYDHLLE
jgi:hypothetical protein